MGVINLADGSQADCERAETLSGEKIVACKQCGTCTASCPNIQDMDLPVRELMHLVQLGRLDEVLASRTPWVCSSCLQCSVRCPRGIDIARVMEAMRAMQLRARKGRLSPAEVVDPACADAPPILLVSAMRKLTG
ncbi:MAG: 4Fe-4S dicluster domain-containing protein [Deltaproteobacteria bacterium]|nr:4Fe-4S dicluster domain-containing protein [Deltaproteobacteria bacterium]